MRPVTRADCTHDSTDGTNARIWHPGPSTPAAIWLVIKRIALLAAFCEAICRGVLMSGRKLAIPFDRISNLTPRNG
jgi:hypothetical protein